MVRGDKILRQVRINKSAVFETIDVDQFVLDYCKPRENFLGTNKIGYQYKRKYIQQN